MHPIYSEHPHLALDNWVMPVRGVWSWTVDPSPQWMGTLAAGTILRSTGVIDDEADGSPTLVTEMTDLAELVSDGAMHFSPMDVGFGLSGSSAGKPLTRDVMAEAFENDEVQMAALKFKCWTNDQRKEGDIVHMRLDISVENSPEDVAPVDRSMIDAAEALFAEAWLRVTGEYPERVVLVSIPTCPEADRFREIPSFAAQTMRAFQTMVSGDAEREPKPIPMETVEAARELTHYSFQVRDERLAQASAGTHIGNTMFVTDLADDTLELRIRRYVISNAMSDEQAEDARKSLAANDLARRIYDESSRA